MSKIPGCPVVTEENYMMPQFASQFISVCRKMKFSLLSYFRNQALNPGSNAGCGIRAPRSHPRRGRIQQKIGHLEDEVFFSLSTGTKIG